MLSTSVIAPRSRLSGLDRDLDASSRAFGFDGPPARPLRPPPAFSVTRDADGVTVRAELPGVDPAAIGSGSRAAR